MDPTFDDLIPGHPAYSQVSFDDLIPGHRAYAPPGGGVSFDDLIPTQGAPWQPARGSAGAVDFGHTLGNVSVGPGAQRSQSDYAAASAPYGQSMLTSVSPRTLAQYEGAAGLDLNVGQDPGVPDHVSGASLPSPGASARHLQAAAASSPFPIPLRSLSGDAEAADARGPQLSPAVRAYLLAPGTPVSASGAPAPVRLVSPGPGNVTIDTYPEKNTTIPEIPAPLLAPGASVRSQADDYTRLSYLVSSKGSSENYSPLTFVPGALGIATAKPGDTWAGVKLTSDDIAAAQRFTEWAQRSRLENSPDLGGAWNGYRFVQEGGINPAQQRFAALKAALDQQYWWMAVPALAPLAVAGAPTIASALDTGGAWLGSQFARGRGLAAALGLGGAGAVQLEEEAAPSVGESGAGDLDTYVSGLYSKPTPTSSPAGLFEVEQTGPVNYRLVGKDAAFDIDGYEGRTILDAKFISDAANSPFVEGSNVPDAVRLKIWNREMDAFQRLKSLIYDPDVPFVGLRILTNHPRAVPYFRYLMDLHQIPGEVNVVTTKLPFR